MAEIEIGRIKRNAERTIAVRAITDHECFGDYVTVDTVVTKGNRELGTVEFAVSAHELPRLIQLLQKAYQGQNSRASRLA